MLSYQVLIRAFRTILVKGYANPKVDDDDDDGANDGQFEDDVDGTGMGQGEGKKDVSDQIEDEEQLLGLQGEQQQDPQENQQEGEDNGVEMQTDFDGQIQDIPDDDNEEEGSDSDDDEKVSLWCGGGCGGCIVGACDDKNCGFPNRDDTQVNAKTTMI